MELEGIKRRKLVAGNGDLFDGMIRGGTKETTGEPPGGVVVKNGLGERNGLVIGRLVLKTKIKVETGGLKLVVAKTDEGFFEELAEDGEGGGKGLGLRKHIGVAEGFLGITGGDKGPTTKVEIPIMSENGMKGTFELVERGMVEI